MTPTPPHTSTSPHTRILFTDLDGTIRHSSNPSGFINEPTDVLIYPAALLNLRQYHKEGWTIVGITNQGGVALGHLTLESLHENLTLTNFLCQNLFSTILYCPHDPKAQCLCRKPNPGLIWQYIVLYDLMDQNSIFFPLCPFVGDRPEDELCAKSLGIPFQLAPDWRANPNFLSTAP